MTTRTKLPYIITTAAALAVGGIGAIFTTPEIHTWYAALTQPSWTPPNWVFGPVWTTLYILMGISAGIIWKCGVGKRRHDALALYWGQLVFNLGWSIVFFGLHSILGGLIVIIILALMIIALMVQASHISKRAVWLLVPYILWVCYATSLNLGIYFLN